MTARRRLHQWWYSRAGAPLLAEICLLQAMFVYYKLVRFLVRDRADDAFANARSVVALERRTGLFTELAAQRLALRETSFVVFANRYYVTMHFPAMVALLVLVYARQSDLYERIRRALIFTTSIGLVLHVTYPLAPPRMLSELHFIDTMARFGPNAYRSGEVANFANQFAAMPSMHFAWSAIVAYAVVAMGTSRWRWLIVAHPIITTIAIVITANHYWLDAIVAGVILMAVVQVGAWQDRRQRQRFTVAYGAHS